MNRKHLVIVLIAGALGSSVQPAAARDIVVQIAPPAPRVEIVPAPRHGYAWAPGHWGWRGNRHVWVDGRWVRARPGYAYNTPRWIERGDRWYQEPGRWTRGDRDRDGVPNRHDRAPRNPRAY